MERGSEKDKKTAASGVFFLATLILWLVSLLSRLLFNRRTELLPVLAGSFFYQSFNSLFRSRFSPPDPLFVNTCVSLLHSSLTSASVMFIFANRWMVNGFNNMFDHSQLFEATWPWAYPALCFSCGYFAYDQWDMLHHRLYSGWIPSILLHHLILLICVTLALFRNVTINYLILTLICELHSIFLHVRKVRRMAGVLNAKSQLVRVEWALNWTTFVFARFTAHVLITIKLIKDAPKFRQGGIELPLALFGMAGMNLLNIFLAFDLLKAYKREMNPKQNRQTD